MSTKSTGIFIEIDFDESSVKKLLTHKFEQADFGKKIGYYFSELLYECNKDLSNVFIFNYDTKTNKCFIAYYLQYFNNELIKPFESIFKIISTIKKSKTSDYAIIASTFPKVFKSYTITNNGVKVISQKEMPSNYVENLLNKFWTFSEKNDFPEPKKALSKRNYFYKNFKNYYKKYLIHIEELDKPNKITKATKKNPYHLFDNFYTFDLKVFQFRKYTNQIIEIPKADPFTFRKEAEIKADKNFVFKERLTADSPPKEIKKHTWNINNPNAIWEWVIVEGIDGKSFEYLKEKWDTVYWKDKNAVYIFQDSNLIKVELADSKTFDYLDFCYGKDKNHIFYLDKIIPINVNYFKLNKNGFIFDKENIFHYQNQIFLDAKTFKVREYSSEVNPFIGTFKLEDKNGLYEYNRDSATKKLTLITK